MKKLLFSLSLPLLAASGVLFANAQAADTSTCIVITQDLGLGSTDATSNGQVSILQNYLSDKGFIKFKTNSTGAIIGLGNFGAQTVRAVMQFQKSYGINPTGYVGPLTRSNIQTLTCARGTAQDIVNHIVDTASTTNQATSSLLTFVSPAKGDLIIKGEKDIALDWTISPQVTATFPQGQTRLKMGLVNTDGQVEGFVGNGVSLANSHGEHRVSGEFQRTLTSKSGRTDNVITNGAYKIRASIVYTPALPLCTSTLTHGCVNAYSAADQALMAQAASYGSDSPWFYVVDPAPKPEIKVSASETNLVASAPVTITWTATASSTGCTFTDVVASTTISVSPSGSQVVTPLAATSTYRVSCNLTSEWPFPGMSYTTSANKSVRVFIGSQTPSATEINLSATDPRRSDGRVTLSWTTTAPAPVAIDIVCPVGMISFTTNQGNTPTCEKGGVWQWSDATTSGSINVTPSGNAVSVPVTFTATVLKRVGGSYIATEQKQEVKVTFPATANGSTTLPAVNSITPSSGAAGTQVTIKGTGLSGTSNIEVHDATLGTVVGGITPTSVSNDQVRFTIPSTLSGSTYNLIVVTSACAGGCSSNLVSFTVTGSATQASATIDQDSLTTSNGNPTISGTAKGVLDGGVVIKVGGNVFNDGVLDAYFGIPVTKGRWQVQIKKGPCTGSISCPSPTLAPGTYPVSVYNGYGDTTNATPLVTGTLTVLGTLYNCNGVVSHEPCASTTTPNISSINPSSVVLGRNTTVTLKGTNFDSTFMVELSGPGADTAINSKSVSADGTRLTFVFPSAISAAGKYTVQLWKAGPPSVGSNAVELNAASSSKTVSLITNEPEVLGAATQCVDLSVNMHRGYEIPVVSKLQSFLMAKGLLNETTGFYGDKTVAAVKMYQESKGLPQSGMVYGATRAAIAADSCQ